MALSKRQIKTELIEQVVERVQSRLDGERAESAERFVRHFYSNVPHDDLIEEEADNLYGAALNLWSFLQEREPGSPELRVYNPRQDSFGWASSHTVVEIVNDDMPFLVDSVVAALVSDSTEVHLIIHPVFQLRRDEEGKLLEFAEGDAGGDDGMHTESVMQVQISEKPEVAHAEIEQRLTGVLADVRTSVEDWPAMRDRCREIARDTRENPPPLPEAEIAEGTAFLDWLDDDNFTYLGFREYMFEGEGADAVAKVMPTSGLGLLRSDEVTVFAKVRSLGPMPHHARNFLRRTELLVISKAERRSTVHRAVHLDAIAIKILDDSGEVVGQRLFVGLFTSAAYSMPPGEIPFLRHKVQSTLERSGLPPSSHDGKALQHILDSYPRDELFQITEEKLYEIAMGILHLQERQRIALFSRIDAFERFVSCLVYVPRDRFDTALRLKFQKILSDAWEGELTDYYTHLTDSKLARLLFIVTTTPGKIPDVDEAVLEKRLVDAGRTWADRLREALVEARGEEKGLASLERFGNAFPASYQDHFNAQIAVHDIAGIERALAEERDLHLYRPLEAKPDELRLKIYVTGERVPLSDVLPMLENMGLRVIDEVPYAIRLADREQPVWIRDFVMRLQDVDAVDISSLRDLFHEALGLVRRGEMEDDGFNRLVLCAGLSARRVTILRALCKYLLQVGIPFSQSYMEETLASNPELSALLVELFLARTDPDPQREGRSEAEIVAEIDQRLEAVDHLDEDRIIRRFRNLVVALLRTNYFQHDAEGRPKSYLSLKFDSQAIHELPKPRPFREIFIYSTRFEAIHLRGGRVARGGIRWSDRREDFRTEVLKLMKAQMVKNAVIVPVGSKGGFVVKQPPEEGGREALLAEGIECYKTMMRGILDITDNLEGDAVVPPPDVRRHDDDDPYLVVAADKGTATFSDIANGISEEYGFWLGDAFASGGSAGYDHKGMAITARGAWESVKRHFRELGKNIQEEPFDVVGVGDMSGDVFGNGMLLSRQIRLRAAFNHLHVFVDPDPDPAVSFEERKRLFELPRSSWADYSAELISAGGGVFERSAKSIPVSPEMAEAFGIEEEQLPPSELIRALLRAPVELLWFGGIGTYVKASEESHAMVGDRSNDALRIDADEVRAKVIGEGANLAMTQRARVELGLAGGRLNTDSIDNSAGVDCSDHEVNIKILLGAVESAGDMTRKQRDQLLVKMTDEVADLVLRDNYLQTQAISVTHQLGARLVDRTARFIRRLEKGGRLDRAIESLPDDETMAERAQHGTGLTRPEVSVLLSYAKMELYAELLASDLPEDGFMKGEIKSYFPAPLRKKHARRIADHRLRREIVATVVTNDMVNRVGIAFLHEVRERTGMEPADIARAYLVSREAFGMPGLWARVEELDNQVPATLQSSLLAECGRLIERGTVWFLREEGPPLDISELIEAYRPGISEVAERLDELLSESHRQRMGERIERYVTAGAPEEIARLAARLPLLAPGLDIVRIARDTGVEVGKVGAIYFAIGTRLGFEWLRRAAGQLPNESAWDKLAITAIVDDLYGHQSDLARRVIESAKGGKVDESTIDRWATSRRSLVAQTDQLLHELQSLATPSLAMLAVANRQLKSMSG